MKMPVFKVFAYKHFFCENFGSNFNFNLSQLFNK